MTDQATAEDLLKEGELAGALVALQNAVRSDPADARLRVFLFQLLCVHGAWERALNQLNVAGEIDSQTLPMVQTYREVLRCEALRNSVYAGTRHPLVFGDPQRWIALALELNRVIGTVDGARIQALREEAYADAPAVSGRVNGEPFQWIMDADSRVGPFVEAIVNGGLYWVPLDRISRIDVHPPEDLRDLVWTAVDFTWSNGGEAVGFIPTRYPGGIDDTPPECLLSRRTDWQEAEGELFFGKGQRVYMTEEREFSLLEIQTIEFDTEDNADHTDMTQSGDG